MKKIVFLFLLFLCSPNIQAARADYATYDEARAAARANAAAKKYSAARADLEKAVKLAKTPEDKGAALILIGETYKLEGNGEQARAAWKNLVAMPDALPSSRVGAQMAIGFSLVDEEKPALGRAELLKVETIKGATLAPHEKAFLGLAVGSTYGNEKNYAQARLEWNKVLDAKFSGPNVLPILLMTRITLAESYLDEGNAKNARQELVKLLQIKEDAKLAPEDKTALLAFKQSAQLDSARSYLIEKNYTVAKTEYQKALQMTPLQPGIQAEADKQLAFIAQQSGDTTKK